MDIQIKIQQRYSRKVNFLTYIPEFLELVKYFRENKNFFAEIQYRHIIRTITTRIYEDISPSAKECLENSEVVFPLYDMHMDVYPMSKK